MFLCVSNRFRRVCFGLLGSIAWLLILAGIGSTPVLADTTLRIRDQVAVGKATIQVKDIAEVEDEDQERSLAISQLELYPTPTAPRTLRLGEIRDRLELLGVDLFEIRFQGSQQVRIEPVGESSDSITQRHSSPRAETQASTWATSNRQASSSSSTMASGAGTSGTMTFDTEALERFCRTRLERRIEELDLEWKSLPITPETARRLEGTRWISVDLAEMEQSVVAVLKIDRDGAMEELRLPVLTTEMPRVVFLSRTVARGQVLKAEDLEMRPWPSRDASRATSDPQELVGKQVEGAIQRDRPVDPQLVAPPTLVRRGARVKVVSRVDEIQVSTTGTSMGEGGLGDEILVQLSDRRGTLSARIAGENRVEIVSGSTQKP